jgi:radical SAM superfamily enzyme YgiQ (UPF0313 family)
MRALKVTVPKSRIVLGGAHPGLAPRSTFEECREADAIVPGEGESACLDTARATGDLTHTRGLYLCLDGRVVFTSATCSTSVADPRATRDRTGARAALLRDGCVRRWSSR